MKKTRIYFIILFLMLCISINPVFGDQHGVTVGGTVESSNTISVYIPNGTYHTHTTVNAYLGMAGSARCESTILSIVTQSTTNLPNSEYIFESVVTINTSNIYNFTVTVVGSAGVGYYANFAIILTDLDVKTLTKTSVIGEAPFNIEFVVLGIICISIFYVVQRQKQQEK